LALGTSRKKTLKDLRSPNISLRILNRSLVSALQVPLTLRPNSNREPGPKHVRMTGWGESMDLSQF
jgi:hypothetical protein